MRAQQEQAQTPTEKTFREFLKAFETTTATSDAKSHAPYTKIVEFLTCLFMVIVFAVLKDFAKVVTSWLFARNCDAWRSLWVQHLPLNAGQL